MKIIKNLEDKIEQIYPLLMQSESDPLLVWLVFSETCALSFNTPGQPIYTTSFSDKGLKIFNGDIILKN